MICKNTISLVDKTNIIMHNVKIMWVLSSVGRAAPLQGVGQEFEPLSTHHMNTSKNLQKISFQKHFILIFSL